MEELQSFIQVFASQGIFCGLFIWLFISTNKDNKERKRVKRQMESRD